MEKRFNQFSKAALILVYLVIVAGAVVRMTGSGMGCPDWPKCFGYYIPPTQESQIEFKSNHFYQKNEAIIYKDILYTAQSDFTSSLNFKNNNWKKYTKHNYSKFNATHTWVEYINRLIGVLSGIPILIFFILSFFLYKKDKLLLPLSFLTILGMGFQAWLGKTVVDSNLAPFKITIHMVMALAIVAILLILIFRTSKKNKLQTFNKTFHYTLLLAIVLTLIQVILGTNVRQFVDEQVKSIGYIKSEWLNNPSVIFYVHRSFSILIFLTHLFLFNFNRKIELKFSKTKILFSLILLEILTGVIMYYFDFPFTSQPMHLVIASVIFGIQFYLILESNKSRKNTYDI